jgi:hypothetical protein
LVRGELGKKEAGWRDDDDVAKFFGVWWWMR